MSQTRTHNYLILLIHTMVAVWLTILRIQFSIDNYDFLCSIEGVNDSIQYFVPLFTYWMTIFDSISQRNTHKHFWKVFQRLSNHCNISLRSYTIKIIEFFAVTLAITHALDWEREFTSFFFMLPYVVVTRMFQIRIFHYLLCLEVIHFQLVTIEGEIRTLIRYSNLRKCHSAMLGGLSIDEIQKLKSIRKSVVNVYGMVDCLNQVFGWSHLGAILCAFYLVLTDINWIFTLEMTVLFSICECFTLFVPVCDD